MSTADGTITYEGICEKLGFDPVKNPPKYDDKFTWKIDDNRVSPYAVLTLEELLFLAPYKIGKSLG